MLFWESEDPSLGVVHHLMVLCYHLQHPSLLSPEGLQEQRKLLADFLVRGITTAQVRRRDRSLRDSGRRTWKITARRDRFASYTAPVHWTMTAGDVVAGGMENYVENVRLWAKSVFEAIR